MLINYMKFTFRNLRRHKALSFISIFGLALGMAVFLLITLYSQNELSFDKFHTKHKRIYQVEIGDGFYTPGPVGTMIRNNLPDFETIVRIDTWFGGGRSPIVETSIDGKIKKMKVRDIVFADPTLFDMFDFPVIYGDPATALKEPYSIVLTRSTAQNLFGAENVVGQTIHYIGDRNSKPRMDMTVTAIVEDVPNNSSISFNAVGSLATLDAAKPSGTKIDLDWSNWMCSTFISFKQHNISAFTNKLNKLWQEIETRRGSDHNAISLVPLTDVHFHNNSKRQLIFLLQLIGMFILGIAIFNFINLTLAKSTTRTREIGIRKVVGSDRRELIKQFLNESILISLIATPFAIMIVVLSKPIFFKIIDKEIPFNLLYQPFFILTFIAGVTIIGAISGIYPAFFMSAFKPISMLKGVVTKGKKGSSIQHILIVFQFAIAITLFICAIFISKQVDYLKVKDLGFNKQNIIHFNQSQGINQQYDSFKNKLLQYSSVIGVSRSNVSLGRELPIGAAHKLNGLLKPYRVTTVDPDFIPTMQIEMVEGRPFSQKIQSDYEQTAIVNETFVKEFELKPALGAEIDYGDRKLRVIGVMKDFHYSSFHQKVSPAALWCMPWNSHINIRISDQNISQTIQYVSHVWEEFSPETPFEFEFLDQTFDKLYKSEELFQRTINIFSFVAIIIACMGLFGLISHSTDRRIKEIGVRKILGATVNSIVFKLTRDLLKWVTLANIIAWPLAWYVTSKWLQSFAYHTNINWWVFLLAGGIALMLAVLTMSYQAIRAATTNPAEILRHE